MVANGMVSLVRGVGRLMETLRLLVDPKSTVTPATFQSLTPVGRWS
jgi:hypothetical protein